MNELLKNLASLVKVKTIITFGVLLVFIILSLRGDISTAQVVTIVTMVFSFYFGTQAEKKE